MKTKKKWTRNHIKKQNYKLFYLMGQRKLFYSIVATRIPLLG
jgi:hypothetical protein